jgi:hypothetical protein
MDKDYVLEIIRSYTYNKERVKELREKIESICPKLTATYGNLAGATGSGTSNPTADIAHRLGELKSRRAKYVELAHIAECMIERSGLNDIERGLMWRLAENGYCAAYAREHNINENNIYKIRDRAVRKIIAAHTPRNVG